MSDDRKSGQSAPKICENEFDTDTVQEKYGREYSEDTLNVLRGYPKPRYETEHQSMDPIDDLEEYVGLGLRMPPKTYDALQDVLWDDIVELAQLKDRPVDPKLEEVVRYRQDLAEGADPKDVDWLKTRAYYRAIDELEAERERQIEAIEKGLMRRDVSQDHPSEDSRTTAQMLKRKKMIAAAARLANSSPEQKKKVDLGSETSDVSEWGLVPTKTHVCIPGSIPSHLKEAMTKAFTDHALINSIGEKQERLARLEAEREMEARDRVRAGRSRTVYTESYLRQQQLNKQIKQQRRQRTVAFWLSFSVAVGSFTIRMLRKRRTAKALAKAKSQQEKGQGKAPAKEGLKKNT